MSKRPRLSESPVHDNAEDDTDESDSSDSSLSSFVSSSDSSSKTDDSESPSSSSDNGSSDTETDDSSADESEDKVEESFDSEREANHNPARYQCAICAKSFTRRDILVRHRLSHEASKPYSCTWPGCDQRSAIRSNLVRHIRVVHFKVPVTRKGQLAKNGTAEQRQEGDFIHRDDQSLQEVSNLIPSKVKSPLSKHLPCYFNQLGLCNRFFSSTRSRRVHYRIHLSIRPFFCAYPHCSVNYRAEQRSQVLRHIRTVHLGLSASKEKPLDGKESRDAKAYLAVDKELLNPCFTNLPELQQET